MEKRIFKADALSLSSIRKLQDDLEKYRDSLPYKCRLLAERLSERGVEIARVQIADLDTIFTGELLQSVHSDYVSSTKYGAVFAIVADSSHAAMVEFGTGQKGQDRPYPYPLPEGVSWEYNTGKTIRYNPAKGTYYWFYPGQDGKWHYTEGMPSRPFLYLTSMELAREVVKIAKEVFGA